MRKSDKKANMVKANKLAEETFMKEREMMGIPSPKEENMYEENELGFDIENSIKTIIDGVETGKIFGSATVISINEVEVLFEADTFSLNINCDVEYEDDHLLFDMVDGIIYDNNDGKEIKVTKEQLEQSEQLKNVVEKIINDADTLRDYDDITTYEPEYEPDENNYDHRAASKEWGGIDEEINEIKRITKRLLGE